MRWLPESINLPIRIIAPVTVFAQHGYIIGPPSGEDWQQKQLFAEAATLRPGGTVAAHGLDTIWFNRWGATYYAERFGLRLTNIDTQPDLIIGRSSAPVTPPDGYEEFRRTLLPDGTAAQTFRRI